jgi:hypothetical protein
VIYYLLEIHHILSKLKGPMPDIAEIQMKYLSDRFGNEIVVDMPKDIMFALQKQMEGMFKRHVMTELLALQSKYPDALSALAEIDPISCYRLSDLATSLHKAEGWTVEASKTLEEFLTDSDILEAKDTFAQILTPKVVLDNLKTIREALEGMCKGPRNAKMAKEVKKILNLERQAKALEDFRLMANETLDNNIGKLLPGILQKHPGDEE